MKSHRLTTVIAVAVVLTTAAVGLGFASAAKADTPITWYVASGAALSPCPPRSGAHPTLGSISAALACASAGDTISVAAGTFNEHPTLSKSITVVGAGPSTILDGGGAPAVLTIRTGVTATLSNLLVRNGQDGITVLGNATMNGITSTRNRRAGIAIDTPGTVVIGPNFDIHHNGGNGIKVVTIGSGRVFADRPTLRSTGAIHDNNFHGVQFGFPYTGVAPVINFTLGDADIFANKGHGVLVRDDGGTGASNITMLDNDVYQNAKSGLFTGRATIGQPIFSGTPQPPTFAQNKFHSNGQNQIVFDGGGGSSLFEFAIDSPTGMCDAGANAVYSYSPTQTFGVFAQNAASVTIQHMEWANGGTGLKDFSAQSGSVISVSANCTPITDTP